MDCLGSHMCLKRFNKLGTSTFRFLAGLYASSRYCSQPWVQLPWGSLSSWYGSLLLEGLAPWLGLRWWSMVTISENSVRQPCSWLQNSSGIVICCGMWFVLPHSGWNSGPIWRCLVLLHSVLGSLCKGHLMLPPGPCTPLRDTGCPPPPARAPAPALGCMVPRGTALAMLVSRWGKKQPLVMWETFFK